MEFRLSLPAGNTGKVYLSSTLIIIIVGVPGSKRGQGCIQQSGSLPARGMNVASLSSTLVMLRCLSCTEREQLAPCVAATITFSSHGLQSVHQALVMLFVCTEREQRSVLSLP